MAVFRHFLYLTNTRLVSLESRGARIVSRREFAVTGAGSTEFERYLAHMPSMPVHIFVDLAEEDFRLDTVPHVGKGDRDAILARKLTQIFRNTPYRYAQLQGREADGRRDDRVIYTAITNPEILRPWIDVIERLRVPLAGVYSAAVFSAVMLDELDLSFAHTLLVTFTPGDGMRQTYFKNGEIKFSRLTPIDLQEGQTRGSMIAEETTRTWQYLDSLRHFGDDDRLEVCVVVHPNERESIQPALRDFAQIQYRILDIEQVATKLGLRPPPLGSTAEEVFVHLYLMHRVENHFASSELRRHDTLRSIRILVNRAAVAVFAVGVAWGAWNLSRVFEGNDDDQRIAQQMNALNREYDDITRSLPSFGVGGAAMRDAVNFYNGSIKGFPEISDFAVAVSNVMQAYPDVRLSQLTWQATDDVKALPAMPAMPSRNSPAVKAVAKADTAPPPSVADDPNAPFSGGRFEVALVEATVRVPNNDFRGALEKVEQLALDIGRIEGFRAEVVESPLDVRSTLSLQGKHLENEPTQMEPRFVLRIVRERRGAA
jgi:hypothetical protein